MTVMRKETEITNAECIIALTKNIGPISVQEGSP
jgi:hypothetical protein